jgi:succinoglycan biosynthesis transport protein ExoP
MTVQEVRDLLRTHALMLLVAMVLGGIAGLGLAAVAEKTYTARADVFVAANNGSATPDFANEAKYGQDQAENFAAVATREVVLRRVISDLGLDDTPGDLRKRVTASVPQNTSIISITAEDSSAEQAAAIANALATSISDAADELVSNRSQGTSPVRVETIEVATAPSIPTAPRPRVNLLLGILLGLAVGVGAAALRDATASRLRSAAQVADLVEAPVIGAVDVDPSADHVISDLASLSPRRAEQYRDLRASLRFLQDEQSLDTFVFASSVPGEGTLALAAEVAASLAAARPNVCLVEADMRKPRLASQMSLRGHDGLAEVVAGSVTLDAAVQRWGVHDLNVITAGAVPANPSDLLNSPQAEIVLHQIRDRFDVVIVIAPPLVPVSDAVILARLLGGLVLVVSEREVEITDLQRAVERARLVAPILGAVITRLGRGGDVGTVSGSVSSGSAGSGSGSAPGSGSVAKSSAPKKPGSTGAARTTNPGGTKGNSKP